MSDAVSILQVKVFALALPGSGCLRHCLSSIPEKKKKNWVEGLPCTDFDTEELWGGFFKNIGGGDSSY